MCYEMFFHSAAHGSAPSNALIVTAVCGSVLLLMLWKGGAAQWCVACLAVVPFALISLASTLGSSLMIVRYMAFLQPFLLIAVAAALWRIPLDWLRDLIAYAAVAAGLLLHVDFVDSLDIANRPGAAVRGGLYRRQSPPRGAGGRQLAPAAVSYALPFAKPGGMACLQRPAAVCALRGRTGYNCRGRLLPRRHRRRSDRAGVGDYQLGQVGRLGNVPSANVGKDGGAAISRSVRVPERRGCDMLPNTITRFGRAQDRFSTCRKTG